MDRFCQVEMEIEQWRLRPRREKGMKVFRKPGIVKIYRFFGGRLDGERKY